MPQHYDRTVIILLIGNVSIVRIKLGNLSDEKQKKYFHFKIIRTNISYEYNFKNQSNCLRKVIFLSLCELGLQRLPIWILLV